jgi:NDP-sugar pyrophosphorylase family protein
MLGVILAAGKGTRLGALTSTRSKAMMPILGKPVVERVMDTLIANGVSDFVVVYGLGDDEIAHHFGGRPGVRLLAQPERKGMAHALACTAPLIDTDFILTACDNLVAADQVGRMLETWQSLPGLNAVLALMPVEPDRVSSTGIVAMDGPWVTRIVEKPRPEKAPSTISSLPLYLFSRQFLDYLPEISPSPRGEYELQDAIQMLIEREGGVRGVTIPQRMTLTTPADLLAINRQYLAHAQRPMQLTAHIAGTNTQFHSPLRIERGTIIGNGCTIGPNVYLERDCRVGNGVTIRNAVILRGAVVPDGTTIEEQVIGQETTVPGQIL